jgi:cystathionine beta-lyase/cystathionine gamma-synthase
MRPGTPARGHLVRFSIGLEEPAALREDLAQALAKAFA